MSHTIGYERRKLAGQIKEKVGIVILNPYGGIWDTQIFDTAEAAKAHLLKHWPHEEDFVAFTLVTAVQTTEIYFKTLEPEIIPMPKGSA